MAETANRLPITNESKATAPVLSFVRPFGSLRREIDRLLDDFDGGFWRMPFHRLGSWIAAPAVDIAEKDGEYEISAEMPGMEEKDIDIKLSNGVLMITGEKKETKEEKRKGYLVSERRYGSFERSFAIPGGVDLDKISAGFAKGVLTITLPKTPAAQKQEKKITVKAA